MSVPCRVLPVVRPVGRDAAVSGGLRWFSWECCQCAAAGYGEDEIFLLRTAVTHKNLAHHDVHFQAHYTDVTIETNPVHLGIPARCQSRHLPC